MEHPRHTLVTAEVRRCGDDLIRALIKAGEKRDGLTRADIEGALSWYVGDLWNRCERQLFRRVQRPQA